MPRLKLLDEVTSCLLTTKRIGTDKTRYFKHDASFFLSNTSKSTLYSGMQSRTNCYNFGLLTKRFLIIQNVSVNNGKWHSIMPQLFQKEKLYLKCALVHLSFLFSKEKPFT